MLTAVCFCTHLAPVALLFEPTNETLGNIPKLGIYTDYYGINYWQDSLGFFAVLGALVTYITGMIFSVIADIKPMKRMKHKLIRDFRSIDRYGLNRRDEEVEEELFKQEAEEIEKHNRKRHKAPIFPDEEIKEDAVDFNDIDNTKQKDKTTA